MNLFNNFAALRGIRVEKHMTRTIFMYICTLVAERVERGCDVRAQSVNGKKTANKAKSKKKTFFYSNDIHLGITVRVSRMS